MAATTTPGETIESAQDWLDCQHTGPGTLAGRYLRTFGHPIYRSQDLLAGPTRVSHHRRLIKHEPKPIKRSGGYVG